MNQHNVTKLYETIFDVPFLVRYGYYDVAMKKIESSNISDDDLEEYYGKPDAFYLKIFNMKAVSELIRKEDLKKYFNFNNISKNPDTEPISFNIPKSKYTRREYKMPNIYSYIELCYFITENKNEFIDIFKHNVQSTSKYFNHLDFAFEYTKKIEQKLLYGGSSILSIDLSNFYHTLYTHSIPWVVNGKEASKLKRNGGFANDLDKIVQQSQYGETHGIPTGNLASRIIAEMYMCHVDKKMLDKGYKYSRYVDDIKFPFSADNQKESFLMEFSEICRKYNLIINDRKTEISTFPFPNNMEKMEIFSYFDSFTSLTNENKWRKKFNEFCDYCLNEEANGNKGALKCIYSVIFNTLNYNKVHPTKINNIFKIREYGSDFNLYERLLDISLKDSRLTNRFILFTENLISLGLEKKAVIDLVKEYFNENKIIYQEKVLASIANNWNQEIYQILLYCVVFEDYKLISKKIIKTILNSELDDYTACLSVILWIKRKWSSNELLEILDFKLRKVHDNYPDNSDRMKERFWLLRYFIYTLIDHEIISTIDLNNYYKKNYTIQKSDTIIKSELNRKHTIPDNASTSKINRFYNLLLSNKIHLVQLGNTSLFTYL